MEKIAVITCEELIANEIQHALQDLYEVHVYKNGLALHKVLDSSLNIKAIISDDELLGANGLSLCKTLNEYSYGKIPFIVVVNFIDNEQMQLAIKENIAEVFAKPLNTDALRVRIPYLIENFNKKSIEKKEQPATYKLPVIKRIFDITFSGLALLLLSPVFFTIAILIRIESKGPIFYYSLRVGSGYKIFKFYKFRSMFTGADARLKDLSHLNQYNDAKKIALASDNTVKDLCDYCCQSGTQCLNPLYADNKIICETLYRAQKGADTKSAFIKIKNDPRVTKVGNFIRNTSIDELPQLWNVFIGDMSIVGNRPLPLYEAEKITIDKYSPRFGAPAGITGLWQVEKRGKGDMSEEERLRLDNCYAQTHSFGNDIKLILKTIPALFQSENV